MPQHVLIVEDDLDLGQLLSQFIEAADFKVDWLTRGDTVLPFLAKHSPDIILMDVQLPVIDGVTLTQSIRDLSNVPIIMVTSKADEVSRLIGLKTGVDDYVCKPFSAPELVLRINAILRRTQLVTSNNNQGKGLNLDQATLTLNYNGHAEKLTLIEFNLIQLLSSSPNRIYSREQILDLAYNNDRDTNDRTIDSHIKNLRKKLEKVGLTKDLIESVYGVGYRFVTLA